MASHNIGTGLTPPQRHSTFPIHNSRPSSPRTPVANNRAATGEQMLHGCHNEDEDIRRPIPLGSSEEYQSSQDKPRLSKPVELIRQSYDVVVIGSGYGGAVAASRMARGRKSVAVLELGKEIWPGEYPETYDKAMSQLHLSGDFTTKNLGSTPLEKGNATGLYHLILGEGQNAFVANGLGGTSLLNANVFLEADTKTMQLNTWPEEIRNNPDCLRPYYDRARHMLQPQIYPDSEPELSKLSVLQEQARILEVEHKFRKVEQTTWFKEDGLNSSGVPMKKSKLTGMDSTGVNDGSKSTTLVTYLADAWNWGAEIFTQCEVRYIEKHPEGGYFVFFAWHRSGRDLFEGTFYDDLMWVHAKEMVFLGAGSIGSTEILLRSKQRGLEVSNNVGQNMSGNGDLLAFGYNLDRTVNGIGRSTSDKTEHPPVGPTISGIIDCRDQEETLDGFVIEEGAITAVLAPFVQFMLEFMPGRQRPHGLPLMTKISRMISSFNSHCDRYDPDGSLQKTQTYLVMSHDSNQATLTLQDNKPRLQFRGVGRQEHVSRLNGHLQKITRALNGTFVHNPFFAWGDQNEITVHPIGGASMSKDGTGSNGVTNHLGQVFQGEGDQVHKGLVVVDGAVIPTALGANPFATITALAERSVDLLARERDIQIDYETENGEIDLFGRPRFPIIRRHQSARVDSLNEKFVEMAIRTKKEGFEFTEIMSGHIHMGDEIHDFETAWRTARGECEEARFFLSVHAYNAKSFLSSDGEEAMLTGTFTSGALPASPYMVNGDFKLFFPDERAPDTRNLNYDFDMRGKDGKLIRFSGYKVIDKSAAFSPSRLWKATTTLRVTLTDPKIEEGKPGHVIGKGILGIKAHDLFTQLRSYYASWSVKKAFLNYFIKNLAFVFFAPFDSLSWASAGFEAWSAKNYPSHNFTVQAPGTRENGEEHGLVESKLIMWQPTSTTKQHKELLFIGGAAVDEQIFNLSTIEQNAIGYFRNLGYRCWCIIHRVGKGPNAKLGYTTYDARLDIAAAVDKIDELRKTDEHGRLASKTYIIAHCAGSIALAAGLLTGDIKTKTIVGITASQVFMTPMFAGFNSLKARIPYATQAYSKVIAGSEWYDCVAQPSDNLMLHGLDQLLRFYPVQRNDLCNSRVCHRSSFIFGLLWSHHNLNKATHDKLDKYLGGTTMTAQRHLIAMGQAKQVLDSHGQPNILTRENLDRLRGIPILFLSGGENCVYDPESTSISYDQLRAELDPQDYDREVFPTYGHLDLWMGKDAAKEKDDQERAGPYARVRDHLRDVENRMRKERVNGFSVGGEAGHGAGDESESRMNGLRLRQMRVRTGFDGVDVRSAGDVLGEGMEICDSPRMA